jgi:phage I-like protein
MSTEILNRDFQHPADGWYNIEAAGEHPNARAGVVQVIDDTACKSIVNTFNREADKPGFPGMLIDHEHFKHDEDKETRSYGWLMRVQNRPDGIYGQIRWTGTGQQAVDNGDYRFFSTEYAPKDLQVLSDRKPRRVRPLRLDGLTLTNVPNNKGQLPITNRMNNKIIEIDDVSSPIGLKAAQAGAKADDASSLAGNDPKDHDEAATLHRQAAKERDASGHGAMTKYHLSMASMHDKNAAQLRSGDIVQQPGSDEAKGDAATNRRRAASSEQEYVSEEQAILNSFRARELTEDMVAATGNSSTTCWVEVRLLNPQLSLPSESEVRNRQAAEEAALIDVDEQAISSSLRIEAERLSGQTGKPFAECWSSLMRANPSTVPVRNASRSSAAPVRQDVHEGMTLSHAMFLCQTGQSNQSTTEAIRIINAGPRRPITDKALNSMELDAAIQEYRVKHKCGSYDEARRGLRGRHPGYFGVTA